MEEKLTKELADKLMKIEGETRGDGIKSDWAFILQKKGEDGLKRLEDRMAELGYPLKFKEIKTMDFYPTGLDVLSMMTIGEVFGFGEKEFEEMGASGIKFSFILKMLMAPFSLVGTLVKQAPNLWRKYYTAGKLEISNFDKDKKRATIVISDFKTCPVHCFILKGYFSKLLEMVVRSPVTCEEVKCIFRGDRHHEFLLKWD